LDRALGFEPRCWGFKSLRVRHFPPYQHLEIMSFWPKYLFG
jgi:hypothetical protein